MTTPHRVVVVNRGSIALGPGDPFDSPLPGTEVVVLNLMRALAASGVAVTYCGCVRPSTAVEGVTFVDLEYLDRVEDDARVSVLWVREYAPPEALARLSRCHHVLLTEDSVNDLRAIFRCGRASVRDRLSGLLPRFHHVVFASRWHLADWRERLGLAVDNAEVVYNLASHVPWRTGAPDWSRRVAHTAHPRKALAAVAGIAAELAAHGYSTVASADPSLYQDDTCRVIHPDGAGGWSDRGTFADFAADAKHVEFVRPRSVARMADFLAGFSVLLHPDYTEETGATVVIEALRAGLVPVVGDRGALPELVGDAGLVIPGDTWTPEYAVACAEAIRRITPADRRRFAHARDQRRSMLDDTVLIDRWCRLLRLDDGPRDGHRSSEGNRRC